MYYRTMCELLKGFRVTVQRLAACLGLAAGAVFCFYGGILEAAVRSEPATILVLGNSLSAGYGLDPSRAYPSLLQEKIDAGGLHFKVVNAGVSGDTSAGGLARIKWLMRSPVDVLILELGANDGLRGIALESTRRNLREIIKRVRAGRPDVRILIAGMMVPPNLGPDYSDGFRRIFTSLAEETGATLIPFLLEGVAGRPELNLPDGIHPTAEGHKIVAETVWKYLAPVLRGVNRQDARSDGRQSLDSSARKRARIFPVDLSFAWLEGILAETERKSSDFMSSGRGGPSGNE